ncbi:MAG TPA: hypothetical protein VF618_20590 [Thermoanaerobaculia bacterium]
MRCPECQSLNEEEAAACETCGLLLLNAAPPKRRAEDFASQKRRASDAGDTCQFCGGDVPHNAVRCRHCSEILNEDFYRERAARLRSRVNYASWVAYLFGLGALLVFKEVGVVSIAAGLILSIVYYAIPVEPPSTPRSKRKIKLGELLRKQFRIERVALPIPALRNKKLVFVGTPLIAALVGYSANVFLLQEPVNDVIRENAAFQGMKVSAHYQYWVVPGVVVYDLQELSLKQSPIDVQRAFLEFAKKVKDKRYSRVELSHKGTTKFSIDGASFSKLGEEYAKRNFDYVLYRFPRLARPEGPAKPLAPSSDDEALKEFHRQWYGNDGLTKPLANGVL